MISVCSFFPLPVWASWRRSGSGLCGDISEAVCVWPCVCVSLQLPVAGGERRAAGPGSQTGGPGEETAAPPSGHRQGPCHCSQLRDYWLPRCDYVIHNDSLWGGKSERWLVTEMEMSEDWLMEMEMSEDWWTLMKTWYQASVLKHANAHTLSEWRSIKPQSGLCEPPESREGLALWLSQLSGPVHQGESFICLAAGT